jgi:hypothetical protein
LFLSLFHGSRKKLKEKWNNLAERFRQMAQVNYVKQEAIKKN